MGSRAVGAFLAIAAAAAFTVALLTPGWWSGHPTVDGHTYRTKTYEIGLYSATGCNTGGDGTCEALPLDGTFELVGYGELALGGLAAVLGLALGVATLRLRDGRAALAKLAIIAALVAAAGAAVAVVGFEPLDTGTRIDVPIGWGLFVFGGGVVATIAAGIVAPRARREPLRLKSAMPPQLQQPAFDVRELLREEHDSLRPAALGPEPMIGRAVPTSPGGSLAGPAGPLGAPAPLFQQAPTLRPLYEMSGRDVPAPPSPQLPTRAPTPLSRDMIESLVGKSKTPVPAGALDGGTIRSLPPPATGSPAAARSPLGPAGPAPSRASAPSVPAPTKPPAPAPRTSAPTLAHSVPPPPVDTPPPEIKPARDARVPTESDDRLANAMRETESVTAVEVDAEAKARAKARAETDDSTDTGVLAAVSPRGANDTDQVETVGRERISALLAVGDRTDASPVEPSASASDMSSPIAAPPPPALAPSPPSSARAESTTDPSGAEPGPEARPSQVPISTAPASLPPPRPTSVMQTGPTPACPQCEAPMAWVEEHLRFYCKQCRMYF